MYESYRSVPAPWNLGLESPIVVHRLREILDARSFRATASCARDLDLGPDLVPLAMETIAQEVRTGGPVDYTDVWAQAAAKMADVMFPAIADGVRGGAALEVMGRSWAPILAGRASILGAGWKAFYYAVGVQELNARMGLVAAAPTGGAAGTVPAVLLAVADTLQLPPGRVIQGELVAGEVGRVAFARGPVSGAQSGCAGEIGVACAMAAGAAAFLMGGGWEEIDAAGALGALPFIGLECSPAFGLVQYPCTPRNGFAALAAIAAADAACAGVRPPYDVDATLDRIFAIGRVLPEALRETEGGPWMQTILTTHPDRHDAGRCTATGEEQR